MSTDNYEKYIPTEEHTPELMHFLTLASKKAEFSFYKQYFNWAAARETYSLMPLDSPERQSAWDLSEEARHRLDDAIKDVVTSALDRGVSSDANYIVGKTVSVVERIEFADCCIGRDRKGKIVDYLEKKEDRLVRTSLHELPERIKYKALMFHPPRLWKETSGQVSSSLKETNFQYDAPDYRYYVVFDDCKIESGWEWKEDAFDRKKEVEETEPCRILSRQIASKRCGSPADNVNWRNPRMTEKSPEMQM